MLSLVDLKDFAEICRAIEKYTASRDDLRVADGATPSRRFYRKAGGPK